MAIDLGMNNLATCTNMKNNKSLIIAGESLKAKIGYINKEIASDVKIDFGHESVEML